MKIIIRSKNKERKAKSRKILNSIMKSQTIKNTDLPDYKVKFKGKYYYKMQKELKNIARYQELQRSKSIKIMRR